MEFIGLIQCQSSSAVNGLLGQRRQDGPEQVLQEVQEVQEVQCV